MEENIDNAQEGQGEGAENPIETFLFEQGTQEEPADAPVVQKDEGALDANISKQISTSVDEVKNSLESFKREQKVSEFFNNPNNADYKEFAPKIKELALKPEAKGLTIEALANMVVPRDYWIKKGADIAAQANKESAEGFSGGSSTRNIGGDDKAGALPDPSTLTKEQFEKQAWDIARGV